jgi:hypothetical protein
MCLSELYNDGIQTLQTPINGVYVDVDIIGVPVYLYLFDPNGNDVYAASYFCWL